MNFMHCRHRKTSRVQMLWRCSFPFQWCRRSDHHGGGGHGTNLRELWGFGKGCGVRWQHGLVQEKEVHGRRWRCCHSKQEGGCHEHQEEDCGGFLTGWWCCRWRWWWATSGRYYWLRKPMRSRRQIRARSPHGPPKFLCTTPFCPHTWSTVSLWNHLSVNRPLSAW